MDMRKLVLLDSDSTENFFCNNKYVKNIRPSEHTLVLNTNGGVMESNMICDVPHLGTHWFNKNSLTNIIALKDMADKFRVTYDSENERAMQVHMPDKIIRFKEFSNGLYARNPYEEDKKIDKFKTPPKIQMLNTLEENLNFLSSRQQQRAKMARKLYNAVGTPTVDDLKAMIRLSLIRNNEITTDDIKFGNKSIWTRCRSNKG